MTLIPVLRALRDLEYIKMYILSKINFMIWEMLKLEFEN